MTEIESESEPTSNTCLRIAGKGNVGNARVQSAALFRRHVWRRGGGGGEGKGVVGLVLGIHGGTWPGKMSL